MLISFRLVGKHVVLVGREADLHNLGKASLGHNTLKNFFGIS